MSRPILTALVASALVSTCYAQGPIQRLGQALDRTGKNIRGDVENAVTRVQVSAQERDLLARVSRRINWDKRFLGSALQLVVRADGTVYLRGSVANPNAKIIAVDLVENTLGVTRVVDELAVVKEVRVIQSRPLSPESRTVVVPPSDSPLPLEPPLVVPPVESEPIKP